MAEIYRCRKCIDRQPGVGFSIFMSTVIPMGPPWLESDFHLLGQTIHWQLGMQQIIGVAVILLLTCINCFSVAFGGKVHLVLTLLKTGG